MKEEYSFGPCQVMVTENKGILVCLRGERRFGDSVREQSMRERKVSEQEKEKKRGETKKKLVY